MPRIIACPSCDRKLRVPEGDKPGQIKCPQCGERFAAPPPLPETVRSASLSLSQMLALGGTAVLLLGVFLPLVSVPVVGNMNYIQNGTGNGVIIIIVAVIAAFAVLTKSFRWVWLSGLASLALLAFTFTRLQVRIAEARDAMQRHLADNPF